MPMDRRAARHAETRREIVRAAWQLSSEHGLQGWSLRDLATAVDMQPPSLYGYFDAKDDIYDAMFADGYRTFLERIAATPGDGEPTAAVHRAARTYLDFCVERPARFELLFLRTVPGFEPSSESYELARSALAALREVLRSAGLDGQDDLDLWTAVLTGLATQQVSNDPGGARWTRLLDRAVDAFVA